MLEHQSVLAIIPARGGSKRFPGKNLALFQRRSLLGWAILHAKDSQYIDGVVVSTDSIEIANHANSYGLTAIMRPKELATDTARSEDVMRHVLTLCQGFDWVVLLQPTSPLRIGDDIDRCLEQARKDIGCISYRERNGTRNGAVYVIRRESLEAGRNFDFGFRGFYIMPDSRSLDIDYPEEISHFDLIQSHCAS